jgi:N-acetylmuramoyl-L-alanine amidase
LTLPKIYLSPSFQEHNVGTGNYGTEEEQMNKIGDSLFPLLIDNGFIVKRNDRTFTLDETIKDSNKFCAGNDIHLSIHSNAANGQARGARIFYYGNSKESQKLAECIYSELSPLTPVSDAIIPDLGLRELKDTIGIAVLIEVSFHDNNADADWIINNIYNIALAIAKGVCKYSGIVYHSKTPDIKSCADSLTKIVEEIKVLINQLKEVN